MESEFLETIKILDGKIFNMSYHQKRYEKVLSSFGVDKAKKLEDFISPPEKGLYRCRLVYDLDAVEVSYHKYKKKEITSLKLVYNDDIDYSLKSTDRESINRLFALRNTCDDILIVKNSLITDTSIANVAFFDSVNWTTPKEPLLKGTTRARLLDEGKIIEADIKVEDLENFSKVALLNAMIDFDILKKCKFLI